MYYMKELVTDDRNRIRHTSYESYKYESEKEIEDIWCIMVWSKKERHTSKKKEKKKRCCLMSYILLPALQDRFYESFSKLVS